MQWSNFFYIFLHCKIIIRFLELFSAFYFLCILQTQLSRRNASIPKKLLKNQNMTFMMTLSNDYKKYIYQDLFHIVNTVYLQNFI